MAGDPDKTGRLEEPVFVRGFDPLQARWKAPLKRSPWERHFELGRQHPGQWMKVSEVKKGGCRERTRAIGRDRASIEAYLERRVPLERWQLRVVTLPDTWCDRELYMRFLGTLTVEEDQRDRAERKARYAARQGLILAKKAERAQAARRKAQEEEAAAQVKIRARRRPGG